MERRVGARHHRRLAGAGVGDHVAELDPLGGLRRQRERGRRLLPEHVRVVRPAVLEAVLLGEHEQLDQALVGRVGEDGDAEAQGHRHNVCEDAAPVEARRGRRPIGALGRLTAALPSGAACAAEAAAVSPGTAIARRAGPGRAVALRVQVGRARAAPALAPAVRALGAAVHPAPLAGDRHEHGPDGQGRDAGEGERCAGAELAVVLHGLRRLRAPRAGRWARPGRAGRTGSRPGESAPAAEVSAPGPGDPVPWRGPPARAWRLQPRLQGAASLSITLPARRAVVKLSEHVDVPRDRRGAPRA